MDNDSEIAGVKIDKKKMRVVFEKPVNTLTDKALRTLLNALEEKDHTYVAEYNKITIEKRQKYSEIAEKIVEGLPSIVWLGRCLKDAIIKEKLVEYIAVALKNLTYGNLGTLTLRDNKGNIVAKLYILPDGTLADDSWVCNEGWKK